MKLEGGGQVESMIWSRLKQQSCSQSIGELDKEPIAGVVSISRLMQRKTKRQISSSILSKLPSTCVSPGPLLKQLNYIL